MRRFGLLVAGVAVLILAGCDTAEPTDSATPGDELWQELFASVEGADLSRISEAQRALLERAAEVGGVSYEDYASAVDSLLECVRTAGLAVDGPRATTLNGSPLLQFGYGASPGSELTAQEVEALIRDCEEREYTFVNLLYANQTGGSLDERTTIMANAPALIACVRSYGVEIEDDPTFDELTEAVSSVVGGDDLGPNCYEEIGLGG